MKVLTGNPIYVVRSSADEKELFSSLNGNSAPDDILKFQYWMEHNHDNVKYGQLRVWDKDTANAWKLYGKEYEKDANKPVIPTNFLNRPVTSSNRSNSTDWTKTAMGVFSGYNKTSDSQNITADPSGPKMSRGLKKTSDSQNITADPSGPKMSSGLKIGLIAGGIILAGIGIYLLTRPKTSK